MGGIVVIALIGAVVWLLSLYFHPWHACWRCKGSGRNTGSTSRRHGDCRICDGSGRRARVGARAVHRTALGASKRLRGGMRK